MAAVPGLNVRGGLTPSNVPAMRWEPSIGIAAARVNDLAGKIKSFREPLLISIREVMVPSIRRNFDQGGRPAWEPLSSSTLKIRKYYGIDSSKILVRSGALRRVASQINIWTVTATTAMILDLPQKVWYGKIQQAGASSADIGHLLAKHGNLSAALQAKAADLKTIKDAGGEGEAGAIPAREFILFQEEDIEAIHAVFGAWLDMRIEIAWPKGL